MKTTAIIKRSGMLGDVISVEPCVRALRIIYKKVYVNVGNFYPVFYNNPYISNTFNNDKIEDDYVIFNLDNTYENSLHILRERVYLKICGVSLPDSAEMPRLYVTKEEIKTIQNLFVNFRYKKWATIDRGYPFNYGNTHLYLKCYVNGKFYKYQRPYFSDADWIPIIKYLKDNSIGIIQIGNRQYVDVLPGVDIDLRYKTSLRDLFAIIKCSDFFIGMESGAMHVAQALDTHGLGIFNNLVPVSSLCPYGSKIIPIFRSSDSKIDAEEIISIISKNFL